jgi:7,8-dihydro-6-hydroxymethylpterin dimethyltransferase
MPLTQKPYDVLEATLSLCPACMATVPAKLVEEGGRVFIRKHCPVHGLQVELLEDDAGWFRRRNDFSRPGSGCATQTEVAKGCPLDCGLCPSHEQHTCIGLVEVTTACDLACTACYASSGPGGAHLPLARVQEMIDFYMASESGQAEILQISGGEPTLHPKILDIIHYARSRDLAYVMLNTNGLRLARDEAFVRELAAFEGGFEVYLQFDGLGATGRGGDVLAWKLEAIRALERHNVPTTLVMTVEAGVNDHALGDVIAFALGHRNIRGVNFQPLALFGRVPQGVATQDRATLTGVLKGIEAQTKGQILLSDFIPLPCDVDRVAVNYLYRNGEAWTPITRGVDFRGYLPFIRNTFNFKAEEFMQAAAPTHGCCGLADLVKFIPPRFLLKNRTERVAYVNENLFRLSVVSFLDAWNFDLKAMQKECVHIITPDLRKIPFSAYNMLHRGHHGES